MKVLVCVYAFTSALRSRVVAFALALAMIVMLPIITAAQTAQTQSDSEDPNLQDLGTTKGGLQTTVGPVNLRFYGRVLLNASISDSAELGQDVPLWAAPGSGTVTFPDGSTLPAGHVHDLIFTARQSTFGFRFSPAKQQENGWRTAGVFEFDFFGTRPTDSTQPEGRVFNQPRLRLANLSLEKGRWKIVAGQDKAIIAPLDPVSLSHVGAPLGATAGNLWAWLPQARVEMVDNFGKTSTLFQIGVLRPLFADPRLQAATGTELPASGSSIDTTASGLGERSTQPFYESRFAISHPMAGSTATIGFGGHFGREVVGAARDIDSWAFALDFRVPLASRVNLRGEAYIGSNLVPFQGGILQGVAATPNPPPASQTIFTTIQPVGDGGGWGELTYRATKDNKNIFYAGAGTDDPKNAALLPGTGRAKNTFAWASYFRKLTSDVTLALEWSNWQFRTLAFTGTAGSKGPSGRGNVANIALAYTF